VGVKAIQLLRANFVNSSLQLNDYNGQLFFIYSRNTTTAIPSDGYTFHVIRLHPSWFVPYAGYTAFTKNKYFNNGQELLFNYNSNILHLKISNIIQRDNGNRKPLHILDYHSDIILSNNSDKINLDNQNFIEEDKEHLIIPDFTQSQVQNLSMIYWYLLSKIN
jgi:hypothetical protein